MNRFHTSILEIENTVAESGFLSGMTEGFRSLHDTLADPAITDAAHALGENLGATIRAGADAFGFLARNADLAVTALEGLLIARTVAGGVAILNAALGNVTGLLRAASGYTTAFGMSLVAMEMKTVAATAAMKAFNATLSFLGGPVGVISLAAFGLYELATGQDEATEAARRHAEELQKLKKGLGETTKETEKLNAISREEASVNLKIELLSNQEHIKNLKKEIIRSLQSYTSAVDEYGFRISDSFHGHLVGLNKLGMAVHTIAKSFSESFSESENSVDKLKDSLEKLKNSLNSLANQKGKESLLKVIGEDKIKADIKSLDSLIDEFGEKQAKLDALNDKKTKSTTPETKPKAETIPALSDEQRKNSADIIAKLQHQIEYQTLLNDARNQGAEAVHNVNVAEKVYQDLQRSKIELTGEETKEQKAITEQLIKREAKLLDLKEAGKALQEQERKNLQEQRQHERERKKLIEEVEQKYKDVIRAQQTPDEQANNWRNQTLDSLDKTKEGYNKYAAEVEAIYQDLIDKARDEDWQNAKDWEAGLNRGFKSVIEQAADMASQTENLVTNAFGGMTDALTDFVTKGKADFKSLADSMVAHMIRIMIQSRITGPLATALGSIDFGSLFNSGNSGGGVGTTPILHAHTGGVIGSDTLERRHVNPAVFATAPRFHSGGLVAGEVPIIAKRGETVFTAGQMRLLSRGQKPVKVEVTVHNNAPGVQARTETSPLPGGGSRLDIIVEQIEGKMTRNVSRGEGLAPTLERRYGLNPARGSYS